MVSAGHSGQHLKVSAHDTLSRPAEFRQDADDEPVFSVSGEDEPRNRRHGWIDRIMQIRNRILGNAAFQRWASSFPLTRPIGRWQARALFDLCAGFVYSQILAACLRLKLIERLWDGPMNAEILARQCGLPLDSMQRLLAGAAAVGLLSRRSGGRYGLSMIGAALYGNPSLTAMVEHHTMLYDDLRDPVSLLKGDRKTTELSRYWPYALNDSPSALDRESVEGYTALMSASQGLIAEDILEAYDFTRHRCLLDIGGGDGTFLLRAAEAAPSLRLTLFDLPPVAERAAERLDAASLKGRAEVFKGDFLSDPLPGGADLMTLIRIVLDHDDASALRILMAARRALSPGGALLIAETVSGLCGSRAVSDAYFGFYLLAMGRGRPRTLSELSALLHKAGFERVRAVATRRPLLTNLVVAFARNQSSADNLY